MTTLTKSMTGLVTDAEGAALAELAAHATEAIVEIGSYTGKSTTHMAEVASVPVYAVDLWDMRLPGEEGARNRKKYKVQFNSSKAFAVFRQRTSRFEHLTWIKGASAEIAKAWTRPIGLLFIDGAHDTASVTADILGWTPHVVFGGYVAFHDAKPGGGKVRDAINELASSGEWEDCSQVDSLAILRRKDKPAPVDEVWLA